MLHEDAGEGVTPRKAGKQRCALSTAQTTELHHIFNLLEVDYSSTISACDLVAAMSLLRMTGDEAELQAAVATLGRGTSDRIDFLRFVQLWSDYCLAIEVAPSSGQGGEKNRRPMEIQRAEGVRRGGGRSSVQEAEALQSLELSMPPAFRRPSVLDCLPVIVRALEAHAAVSKVMSASPAPEEDSKDRNIGNYLTRREHSKDVGNGLATGEHSKDVDNGQSRRKHSKDIGVVPTSPQELNKVTGARPTSREHHKGKGVLAMPWEPSKGESAAPPQEVRNKQVEDTPTQPGTKQSAGGCIDATPAPSSPAGVGPRLMPSCRNGCGDAATAPSPRAGTKFDLVQGCPINNGGAPALLSCAGTNYELVQGCLNDCCGGAAAAASPRAGGNYELVQVHGRPCDGGRALALLSRSGSKFDLVQGCLRETEQMLGEYFRLRDQCQARCPRGRRNSRHRAVPHAAVGTSLSPSSARASITALPPLGVVCSAPARDKAAPSVHLPLAAPRPKATRFPSLSIDVPHYASRSFGQNRLGQAESRSPAPHLHSPPHVYSRASVATPLAHAPSLLYGRASPTSLSPHSLAPLHSVTSEACLSPHWPLSVPYQGSPTTPHKDPLSRSLLSVVRTVTEKECVHPLLVPGLDPGGLAPQTASRCCSLPPVSRSATEEECMPSLPAPYADPCYAAVSKRGAERAAARRAEDGTDRSALYLDPDAAQAGAQALSGRRGAEGAAAGKAEDGSDRPRFTLIQPRPLAKAVGGEQQRGAAEAGAMWVTNF